MKTTVDESSGPASRRVGWHAFIGHHPDWTRRGLRADFRVGESLVLGRASEAFGPGVLDATKVSRRHLQLEALSVDECRLTDLDSRNGTTVDGERLEAPRVVREATVITMGSVCLVIRPGPLDFPVPTDPVWVGCSFSAHEASAALERFAPLAAPVTVTGPPGVGKSLFAAELHARSGRRGQIVHLNCGALDDDRLRDELLGRQNEGPGLLATAADGTLILDHLGEASDRLQRVLLDVLERDELRAVGATTTEPFRARIVATAETNPFELSQGNFRPEFLARLGMLRVALPPLTERLEDVGLLAQSFAEAHAGRPLSLDRHLVVALLSSRWLGNARELDAFMQRAVLTLAADEDELVLTPELIQLLDARSESGTGLDKSSSPLTPKVAADGAWVESVEGERESLDRRPTLQRVLAQLIAASREAPPRALTVQELVSAGWPDERVLFQAGASRVYVVLSQLRKLGLRESIERGEEGYKLVDVRIE